MPLAEKIRTIAKEIYGADDIDVPADVQARLELFRKQANSSNYYFSLNFSNSVSPFVQYNGPKKGGEYRSERNTNFIYVIILKIFSLLMNIHAWKWFSSEGFFGPSKPFFWEKFRGKLVKVANLPILNLYP